MLDERAGENEWESGKEVDGAQRETARDTTSTATTDYAQLMHASCGTRAGISRSV